MRGLTLIGLTPPELGLVLPFEGFVGVTSVTERLTRPLPPSRLTGGAFWYSEVEDLTGISSQLGRSP